ncbi:MAG: RtcB family protein [Bacteroidales bacterium]|nr:RtcB family protein [Bacteroidales bacterium]
MGRDKITGDDHRRLGLNDLRLIRMFGKAGKDLMRKEGWAKEAVLHLFDELLRSPESFLDRGEPFCSLAGSVITSGTEPAKSGFYVISEAFPAEEVVVRREPLYYKIFGREQIDGEAIDQMDHAMRLPVTVAGALMPDAHVGYGLPIGGVLATLNDVVIPYAVGVDIACRMCMSVFPLSPDMLTKEREKLRRSLQDHTVFGIGGETDAHDDTGLFDRQEWSSTQVIRDLKDMAYRQHGTSGAGNHFVEWGILEVRKSDPSSGLRAGTYIALLSHSGSRGFGARVAEVYSGIAMERIRLPARMRHLAWLGLESESGAEYWIAMNLAGLYASDNHHKIHRKISRALGWEPEVMIENHHNFAWNEVLEDGTEVIVHRKGATPAGILDVGIIPGSMTHPGYVVRGKGEPSSLSSASHGAGRQVSRSKAVKTISRKAMENMIRQAGIELIGGHVDECPVVYKDIDQVMAFQKNLVEVLARFTPRIVRMADPEKWR